MPLMMIMIGIANRLCGYDFSILETFLDVCFVFVRAGFEVMSADVIMFHGVKAVTI